MITVQETTVWSVPCPNHKYILSDDRRSMYGYIRVGDKYPTIFTNKMSFDAKGRTFVVLVRTKDIPESDTRIWNIKGSKDNVYTVSLKEGTYSCTCPAHSFRRMICKHIESVQ